MIVVLVLILALAAIACIGGIVLVGKPGEKENICDYGYIEK